ncbi:hypothetical protein [Thermaerobacillus caldiproteolyticus]|uniref:hypothetical protein n=1 Tax=Thermaerobacillus caldiproteolyticus TaxID=247480 RepID=UPI0018F14E2C|nr:hypothetical protein [Anoxybacillus caldiproteolyticus]
MDTQRCLCLVRKSFNYSQAKGVTYIALSLISGLLVCGLGLIVGMGPLSARKGRAS